MTTITVDCGFRPRPLQAEIYRNFRRFTVLVCHRRFGKTVLAIMKLVDAACRNDRKDPPPRYAYIAPFRNEAKDIAWDYLKRYTLPIRDAGGEKDTTNEGELWVRLPNGARIRIYGADNPDSLRGPYLDGVVLDEFAEMAPHAWTQVLRPQLADFQGFALFIGTPKGKNHFHELYLNALNGFMDQDGVRIKDPAYFARLLKASETGHVAQEELRQARRDMTEEDYAQEFECDFEAAMPGAIYGKQMRDCLANAHITRVTHEKGMAVDLWFDLGKSDDTGFWAVQRGFQTYRFLEYYRATLEEVDHFAGVINQRIATEGWNIGTVVFPHDGGSLKQGMNNRTLAQQMSDVLHRQVQVATRPENIWPGINRTRQVFGQFWFDEQRCYEGIEALRGYRMEQDDKKSTVFRRFFKEKPVHDWSSHAADALRTGIMHDAPKARGGREVDTIAIRDFYAELDRSIV